MAAEAKAEKPPKDGDDQVLVHGADQIQKELTEEDKQGFRGVRANPIPLDEYTLKTGPDSPSVVEEQAALAKAQVNA